jgi:uncharacterized protein (UPF0248 family)
MTRVYRNESSGQLRTVSTLSTLFSLPAHRIIELLLYRSDKVTVVYCGEGVVSHQDSLPLATTILPPCPPYHRVVTVLYRSDKVTVVYCGEGVVSHQDRLPLATTILSLATLS